MAEPIEMPFGLWTQMGARKHLLGRVHTGATWQIQYHWTVHVQRRCGLYVKLLWPLVIIIINANVNSDSGAKTLQLHCTESTRHVHVTVHYVRSLKDDIWHQVLTRVSSSAY